RVAVRRALISVSDKTDLLVLARALADAGVDLISTGSTCQAIRDAGIAVREVSEVTGFPESLDGRVKTLHPAIHGGILADRRYDSHVAQLEEQGIEPIDLVVVNLYPFVQTVASGAEPGTVVENIDIGGPAMVRASAKNHHNVAIVVNPADYAEVIDAVVSGGTTLEHRRVLAGRAFAHTAAYDSAVATWMQSTYPHDDSGFAPALRIAADKLDTLRYGENAHQAAALYGEQLGSGIAQATQLHGKEMSYNNYVDADAAVRAAFDHDAPAVAIIKHANPCGIAVGSTIAEAHSRAHSCDPVSAFGGVIAANRTITRAAAESIVEIFTEVIVAPAFDADALDILTTKKNLRLLQLPEGFAPTSREVRQVSGGFLVQESDRHFADAAEWTLVTGEPASAATLADLEFAWRACRAVKSNAILLAHDGASVGIGMGQVNRVDSCHLAVSRAGDRVAGSVAASDAFFPFADGLQVLLDAGVTAVVQPGGSVRDEEVTAAAAAAGITMYFTSERHFYH
ncbi:MAG: bifunctional phosphoribosylaminoimidazolecarboxamide formyltransferase/IMP cyclohydrolase, partial [Actinomycetota bacterium]